MTTIHWLETARPSAGDHKAFSWAFAASQNSPTLYAPRPGWHHSSLKEITSSEEVYDSTVTPGSEVFHRIFDATFEEKRHLYILLTAAQLSLWKLDFLLPGNGSFFWEMYVMIIYCYQCIIPVVGIRKVCFLIGFRKLHSLLSENDKRSILGCAKCQSFFYKWYSKIPFIVIFAIADVNSKTPPLILPF